MRSQHTGQLASLCNRCICILCSAQPADAGHHAARRLQTAAVILPRHNAGALHQAARWTRLSTHPSGGMMPRNRLRYCGSGGGEEARVRVTAFNQEACCGDKPAKPTLAIFGGGSSPSWLVSQPACKCVACCTCIKTSCPALPGQPRWPAATQWPGAGWGTCSRGRGRGAG